MLNCIGKKKQGSQFISCTNTSETPNDARWPETYLCNDCANSRTGRSPVRLTVEVLDLDKPNTPEPEASDVDYEGYEFDDDEFDEFPEEIEI